MFNFVEISPDK